MGSIVLTFDCRSDIAALSGGSWQIGNPLTNLQIRKRNRVARSTDALVSSSIINIDLTVDQALKTFVLGPTNLQSSHKYRIRSYSDAFTTIIHDSDWIQPQAGRSSISMNWSDPHFWTGVSDLLDPDRTLWLIHVFDVTQTARYWSVEIDDTTNPDGFIQLSRLFLGRSWVPSTGEAPQGNSFGFRNKTLTETALSGSRQHGRRTNPRRISLSFAHLPRTEALSDGFTLVEESGFDREVLVIPDVDDLAYRQKRSILGTIIQTTLLSETFWERAGLGFQIEEEL